MRAKAGKSGTWFIALLAVGLCLGQQRGIVLADLTWVEAEKALRPETVVVIPIGAEAKEHGPHLKLKTDYLEGASITRGRSWNAPMWWWRRPSTTATIRRSSNIRVRPRCGWRPRATCWWISAASLARYGPKRFYALNTGVSTLRALQPAAEILAGDGILLRYTDILRWARRRRGG